MVLEFLVLIIKNKPNLSRIGGGYLIRKKIILILFTIIVLSNCLLILPRLIKYNGMILNDIEEYNGYSYAYGTGTDYGLYRKSHNGGKYEKISDASPLSEEEVYFKNDCIYYSSTSKSIVKLDLNTLEIIKNHSKFRAFIMLGINDKYIIAEDLNGDSSIVIFDIDTVDIVKVIEIKPLSMIISNESLNFKDYHTNKSYEYFFETELLIEK